MKPKKKFPRTNLEQWMIDGARNHVKSGLSFGSYSAIAGVDPSIWRIFARENEELVKINAEYKDRLWKSKRVYDY